MPRVSRNITKKLSKIAKDGTEELGGKLSERALASSGGSARARQTQARIKQAKANTEQARIRTNQIEQAQAEYRTLRNMGEDVPTEKSKARHARKEERERIRKEKDATKRSRERNTQDEKSTKLEKEKSRQKAIDKQKERVERRKKENNAIIKDREGRRAARLERSSQLKNDDIVRKSSREQQVAEDQANKRANRKVDEIEDEMLKQSNQQSKQELSFNKYSQKNGHDVTDGMNIIKASKINYNLDKFDVAGYEQRRIPRANIESLAGSTDPKTRARMEDFYSKKRSAKKRTQRVEASKARQEVQRAESNSEGVGSVNDDIKRQQAEVDKAARKKERREKWEASQREAERKELDIDEPRDFELEQQRLQYEQEVTPYGLGREADEANELSLIQQRQQARREAAENPNNQVFGGGRADQFDPYTSTARTQADVTNEMITNMPGVRRGQIPEAAAPGRNHWWNRQSATQQKPRTTRKSGPENQAGVSGNGAAETTATNTPKPKDAPPEAKKDQGVLARIISEYPVQSMAVAGGTAFALGMIMGDDDG